MKIQNVVFGVAMLFLGVLIGWMTAGPAGKEQQNPATGANNQKNEKSYEPISSPNSAKYVQVSLKSDDSDPSFYAGFKFEFIDKEFRDRIGMQHEAFYMEVPQLSYFAPMQIERGLASMTVTFAKLTNLTNVSWFLIGEEGVGITKTRKTILWDKFK